MPPQGVACVAVVQPGAVTLGDILLAIDAALLAGDVHRAHRLLAEALDRCGHASDGAPARRG